MEDYYAMYLGAYATAASGGCLEDRLDEVFRKIGTYTTKAVEVSSVFALAAADARLTEEPKAFYEFQQGWQRLRDLSQKLAPPPEETPK